MASEAEIQFAVNAILDAGFDTETWPAFVVRSKLITELRELESEQRNMGATEDTQNAAYLAAAEAKQAEIVAKQSEIDAL